MPPGIYELAIEAQIYVESGLLPDDINTWQKAVVIIQQGKELGWGVMASLRNINVIKGKPSISAAGLAGIIQQTHGSNALVPVETSDRVATFKYKRKDWPEYRSMSFTLEMAQRAGVGNLARFPAAMLRSRCVSFIAQTAFQAECGGIMTGEELGVEDAAPPMLTVIPAGQMEVEVFGPEPVWEQRYEAMPVVEEPRLAPEPVVTQRQIGFIHGLAREVGTAEDALREFIEDQYDGKLIEELTRGQASDVIEKLQKILAARQEFELASNVKAPESAADGPGAAPEAKPADDDRTVAMKRFFAVVGERGLSDNESRALVKKWYGHDSRSQLTEAQARQAANYIDGLDKATLERAILVAQGKILDPETGEIRAEADDASAEETPAVTTDLQEKAYAELIAQLDKATTKQETALVAKNYAMAHQNRLIPTDRGGVFYSALNEKNRDIEQAIKAAREAAKAGAR